MTERPRLPWRIRQFATLLAVSSVGCSPSYYLVRSHFVPARETPAAPEVISEQRPAQAPLRLAVAAADGANDLAREVERALLATGIAVIPARALEDACARHAQTREEAATALGASHVLYVVRWPGGPSGLRGHFERSYFASDAEGAVLAKAAPSAQLADRLDVLAGRAEAEVTGSTSRPTLEATLTDLHAALVFSYRDREPADGGGAHTPDRTLWVRCAGGRCLALPGGGGVARPSRARSIHVVASAPAEEAPAALALARALKAWSSGATE